jgi:indolepyruvate decarboxylase
MMIAEQLLHALAREGARQIFGIPGDFALPFFKVIEESGILPLRTLSHEPGVGFAADAAARYQGGLGVAAITYGAGAFNIVNPVAGAYAEKSPLVVISGAPGRRESASGLSLHHQTRTIGSQFAVFREITCDQAQLDDPQRAPADIARVLASCKRESRPVYIELPRDMVTVPCGEVPPLADEPDDLPALAACVDETLERLAAASSPVMLVGVEVRRFGLEKEVGELALKLGLPVVTTLMGRGLMVDTATPPFGTYLGVAGDPALGEMVEHSDGLFMLGVILSDTNFGVSTRAIDFRRAIHAADGMVAMGYHTYAGVRLRAYVAALLARVAGRADVKPAARPEPVVFRRGLVADDSLITPGAIATGINDLMARHGKFPLACDIGDCLFTAFDIEQTKLVAPGYYATMGFGVPAGLGVQEASGERPIILVGDGAFQMTGWELGNCARYGWDPIVVVLNNCSWEMLRTFQPESKFNDLDDWHFADAASALGGVGMRVHTHRELAAALEAAAAQRGKFVLIEAMLARGALSPTLERFVNGVRRLNQPPA